MRCVLCRMAAPPRMSIVLSAPLRTWLHEEAVRLGITVSELIRRLLDQARGA